MMSAMSDGEEDTQETDLFNIPWDDVLVPYIGPTLSVKDCFNLRCVSRSGKSLGESILKKVHKLVLSSTLSQNQGTIQVLRKNCKDIRILTVIPEDEEQDVPSKISAENFIILTSGLKRLQHVNLAHCVNLSPRAVHHIFVNSKYMTFLDLTRCCWLTDGALQTLMVHQRHLRDVNLRCCCQISTKCLIKLVALCSNLEQLNLQQLSSVDDSVLAAILHHCNNLNSLNLVMCQEVSPSAIERFLLMKPSVSVKQFGCRSLMCLDPTLYTLMRHNEGGGYMQMPMGLRFF
ncbi:F-box/LRR-repeat protein 15 [Agrilus planipennis]|uniref:F-box/LRR-repeat protein 15 n=1 Tax=Agrilus planipennis TaxID=224129 RepID=A0A1W4WP04_AGRPL|nr:F-box/LRR-repeat protein 15 [Agrilus planipennis]